MSVRVLVLAVIAATLLAAGSDSPASADPTCTDSWTNAAGGAWSNPGNWSSGVPTPTSQVCITLAGTYAVEITAADGTETVAGFAIGGASGTQTLQIDATAQLIVNGISENQANGAISNQGTFLVPSNQTFNQGQGTTSGNAITISNAFLNFTSGIGGASSFLITNVGNSVLSGSLTMTESVELSSATVTWNGPFTNAGTISAAGTSALSVTGGVSNLGLIRAEAGSSGLLQLSGTFLNLAGGAGGIVDNGAVTFSGSLANTGSIVVGGGATFTNNGVVSNSVGGSIANSGDFIVTSNNTFNEGLGSVTGNAITISNAFLNFTSSSGGPSSFAITNIGSSIVTGTIAVAETLILLPGATESGSLTNNGTIDSMATSAGTFINGSVINNGTFRAESGHATTITGDFSQSSGGTLRIDIGDPTNFGRLTISGTATLDGQLNVITSGFTPSAGAAFAVIHSTGARSGEFAGYTYTGQTYTPQYLANGLTLVVGSLAPTLTSIAVTPANPSIANGASRQFTATGTYSDGSTADITAAVTWASGSTGVATISAAGSAHGVGPGTSTISATLDAVSGSTVLAVVAPTLTSIAVTPANPSIANGASRQFTATGTYSDGSTADITATVKWASGSTGVATISAGGLARGVGPGRSTISATLDAVSGSTVLTVVAPPPDEQCGDAGESRDHQRHESAAHRDGHLFGQRGRGDRGRDSHRHHRCQQQHRRGKPD